MGHGIFFETNCTLIAKIAIVQV